MSCLTLSFGLAAQSVYQKRKKSPRPASSPRGRRQSLIDPGVARLMPLKLKAIPALFASAEFAFQTLRFCSQERPPPRTDWCRSPVEDSAARSLRVPRSAGCGAGRRGLGRFRQVSKSGSALPLTLGRCEEIAALPPAMRKGSALPDLRLKTKLFGFRRLPESRRLSAQQAAKPHWRVASDFFTASGLRDGSRLVRNSMWSTRLGLLALNVLDANAANPSARQALQPPDPSVARGFRPVVFGMERHKQMRMSLIRKDIPALVVISRGPNGS